MPPRFAYWTIVLGDEPTAFRAAQREELLPTLKQLRRQHEHAALKWFQRGRLWESPEEAEREREQRREEARARDDKWRPGGEHRDPRERYKVPRDVKRRTMAKKFGWGKGGPSGAPPAGERDKEPRGGGFGGDRGRDKEGRIPWSPRPEGGPASGRPPRDNRERDRKPWSDRPPRSDRSGGFGGDRARGGDRPRGERPQGGERPRGGFGGDRPPRQDRGGGFGGDRPRGDRPHGGGFGGDRPRGGFGGDRPGGSGRTGGPGGPRGPRADRPGGGPKGPGSRRGPQDRPDRGGARKPWSDRPRGGDRPAGRSGPPKRRKE